MKSRDERVLGRYMNGPSRVYHLIINYSFFLTAALIAIAIISVVQPFN